MLISVLEAERFLDLAAPVFGPSSSVTVPVPSSLAAITIPVAVPRLAARLVPPKAMVLLWPLNFFPPNAVMPLAPSPSSLAQHQALARIRIELIDFAMMHYQGKIAALEVERHPQEFTSSICTSLQMNS